MIRPQTCPICEKDLIAANALPSLFPFCSERCRQVDLLRWSTGRYAIVESFDPSRENPDASPPPHIDPESLDPDANGPPPT